MFLRVFAPTPLGVSLIFKTGDAGDRLGDDSFVDSTNLGKYKNTINTNFTRRFLKHSKSTDLKIMANYKAASLPLLHL